MSLIENQAGRLERFDSITIFFKPDAKMMPNSGCFASRVGVGSSNPPILTACRKVTPYHGLE